MNQAASPLLSATGLVKQFGERRVLDDVAFELRVGEAAILTGANGTGKSTLLRILAGLERPDAGQVRFLGQSVSLSPYPAALRVAVGYVHQHPVLFSTSVAANIAYGLKARGVSGEALTERVEAAIAWAGVENVRDVPAARLSGGEKQRVALARAKVLGPQILLLDEPTSNLDGAAREQVIALIARLAAEGRSVLVVGHDRDIINLPGMTRWKLRDGHLNLRADHAQGS